MSEPLAEIELPIIREIGEALYAAAAAIDERDGMVALVGRKAASRRRSGSRARHRHGPHGPTLLIVTLLCASALVLGGLALAGVLGAGVGITPEQWLSGLRARPPTAITAEQSAHLAILRRARVTVRDAVGADDVSLMSHGTFRYAAGADFALSRRVQGLDEGAAWIVPGAGRICLMAYSAVDVDGRLPRGEPGGALCEPDAPVIQGRMVLLVHHFKAMGTDFLAGVVPDGVSEVTVGLADGRQISLAVHEDVYLGRVGGWIAWTSFAGPHGRVTMRPFKWVPLRRSLCSRRGVDAICSP